MSAPASEPSSTPDSELPHRPLPRASPASGLLVLRLGLGAIWALNFLFVLDPSNGFFSGFSATAQSFASTSLGGPGFAEFVAAHSALFGATIAITTLYLAVAFLLGVTTRTACLIGFVFNTALLVTQFGTIVVIPGGTDVGPMPLYLVMYLTVLAGGAPGRYSLDAWWASRRLHGSVSAATRLATDRVS